MAALMSSLAGADHVVLHFHGGLIGKRLGLKTAERMLDEYKGAGAHPVFFVWESGPIETVVNNLDDIFREEIFDKLKSKITKWAIGKLKTELGLKAGPGMLSLPKEIPHAIELKRIEEDEEPYRDFEPLPAEQVGDVTDDELRAFEKELESDVEFQLEVEAILAGLEFDGVDTFKSARPHVAPKSTLMSQDVLDDLAVTTAPTGDVAKFGIVSSARLAWRAGKILTRVVRRVLRNRDHGVYVTTVEEILRELYLANVGATVWAMMKNDTRETFETVAGEERGGSLFLKLLGDLYREGNPPKRITLVGHSTGAIFINNMVAAAGRAAADPAHPLPADFTFGDIVFLAPACSFAQFNDVLQNHVDRFDGFRLFTMDEQHEIDDSLVPLAYPRSLLYFVSGVVERKPDGESADDLPLVGMDRFYRRGKGGDDPFADEGLGGVRDFVLADKRRAVWAVVDGGDGLRSDSVKHAAFDDTGASRATMDSVLHLIAKGWA
jgi:hypothetical protein